MSTEGVKFLKAEHFEEPSTISNIVDYVSSYMVVRNTEPSDNGRSVLWSKFVSCDHNDAFNYEAGQQCDAVLVMGTEGGVQVYTISIDCKLSLLFSRAIGRIDSATVLPSPLVVAQDKFSKERPIMATVLESRLSFYSMRSGRCIKEIIYKTDLVDVSATSRLVVVSSRSELILLSACEFVQLTSLANCRPSTLAYVPVAHCLSEHWLAYAERTLNESVVSVGGDASDPSDKPYALSLMDIKKKVTTTILSEDGDKEARQETGVVSILSVDRVLDSLTQGSPIMDDAHTKSTLLIAHFTAHRWTQVVRMTFDATGTLLLTACDRGLFCHLFRVVPHPTSSSETAVLHLYRLRRGDTPCSIVSLAISKDGRLAAAASDHGTVHVWPISSYGGPLCVRTHCQGHVVNRLSRLERSAGMQEYQVTRPHTINVSSNLNVEAPPNHSLHLVCPRLPPLPSPCTLDSLVQLKPLSSIPITNRPLSLVPFFNAGDSANSPSSFTRTECVLVLSPDCRLLQYALNLHPDPQFQQLPIRTELDAPFIIDKRSLLQWRLPNVVCDCLDRTPLSSSSVLRSKKVYAVYARRGVQTAMLQSVIPDFSECLDQFAEEGVVTPQCWFSNIEISSQISSTSSVRRQDKFSVSTYQSKEPSEVRLEVLQKSPSISSQLSSSSWRADDKTKEEPSSQPMGVPNSEHRIQICNSFCGSSISDSLPDSTDNVIFALAHAIHDEDGAESLALENWEESKNNYIEYMTRDMSQVRLRRVSGSFSSDMGRLSLLSTSPSHADIPEERHVHADSKQTKQGKRQEKKKRKG